MPDRRPSVAQFVRREFGTPAPVQARLIAALIRLSVLSARERREREAIEPRDVPASRGLVESREREGQPRGSGSCGNYWRLAAGTPQSNPAFQLSESTRGQRSGPRYLLVWDNQQASKLTVYGSTMRFSESHSQRRNSTETRVLRHAAQPPERPCRRRGSATSRRLEAIARTRRR
jgi:hypothetical protein